MWWLWVVPIMRAKHPGELEVQNPCGIFQNSEPRKWPPSTVEECTWSPSIAPWLQDQQVPERPASPHPAHVLPSTSRPLLLSRGQQSEGPSQQDNRPVTKDKGNAQRPCPEHLVCRGLAHQTRATFHLGGQVWNQRPPVWTEAAAGPSTCSSQSSISKGRSQAAGHQGCPSD